MDDVTIEEAGQVVGSFLTPIIAVVAGAVVGYLAALVFGLLLGRLGRQHPVTVTISRKCRRPLRAVMAVIGALLAFHYATALPPGAEEPAWRSTTQHALVILLIVSIAWLAARIALVAEGAIADHQAAYRGRESRQARRIVTQAQLLRRVIVAAVWTVAFAAILLTFPGMRAFGASVLASAGIISVVAGLAAQTTLANTFAGMQLAFTDAIRVGDVVIVEEEYGRIEEITLTYVVVHIWDDRRLILPSTYFTATPFENWTRRGTDLLGTVSFDLDWRVPLGAMRAELRSLLAASELWDGRSGSLQVIDSTAGLIRPRVTISASDAGRLWDLQCYIREGLVEWLQSVAPEALPRTRVTTQDVEPTAERPHDVEAGAAAAPDVDTEAGVVTDVEAAATAEDDDLAPAEPDAGKQPQPETEEPAAEEADTPRPAAAPNQEPVGGKAARRLKAAKKTAGKGPAAKKTAGKGPAAKKAARKTPVDTQPAATRVAPTRTSVWQRRSAADIEEDASFYTRTLAGQQIAETFQGPGEEVLQEREVRAQEAAEDTEPREDGRPSPADEGLGATSVMPELTEKPQETEESHETAAEPDDEREQQHGGPPGSGGG